MHFPEQRLICPIHLPNGITVYNCCGCACGISTSIDDSSGPEAFDVHRCSVHITGITIARIANGQIVQGWDNWDQFTMLRQIRGMERLRQNL